MLVRTEYGELALRQTNAPQVVEASPALGRLLKTRLGRALVGTPVWDRAGRQLGEIADVVARADDDGEALLALIARGDPAGSVVAVSFEELRMTSKGFHLLPVTALAQRVA